VCVCVCVSSHRPLVCIPTRNASLAHTTYNKNVSLTITTHPTSPPNPKTFPPPPPPPPPYQIYFALVHEVVTTTARSSRRGGFGGGGGGGLGGGGIGSLGGDNDGALITVVLAVVLATVAVRMHLPPW
jgi:hypothetical protein